MLTVTTTLKSGGDFGPWDAITLAAQFRKHLTMPHEFVCRTDTEINHPLVTEIPLTEGWKGWWSVIEGLKQTGPTIMLGLDSVVVDSVNRLGELAITCPFDVFYMARAQAKPFKKGILWASGIEIWNGNWQWLFEDFDYEKHLERFDGEQNYTQWQLIRNKVKIRAVQDEFIGYYSYKNHCQKRGKPPNDATIIIFHGKPRPSECEDWWVEDIYWNHDIEFVHPFEEVKRRVESQKSCA